jgi:hypothetical protein
VCTVRAVRSGLCVVCPHCIVVQYHPLCAAAAIVTTSTTLAFLWDSGASVGTISGATKPLLSCHLKVCVAYVLCCVVLCAVEVAYLSVRCVKWPVWSSTSGTGSQLVAQGRAGQLDPASTVVYHVLLLKVLAATSMTFY